MKKIIIAALSAAAITGNINAQEGAKLDAGADVVSSYIWRGVYQTGASVQPSLTLGWKNASVGMWGSSAFDGSLNEIDFSISKSFGGISATLTDYFWMPDADYFCTYDKGHYLEANIGYTFGDVNPLTVSWSTMVAGADKDGSGDRKFSSYIEAAYGFTVDDIDLTLTVGASPFNSPAWNPYSEGFAITNISLSAGKSLDFSDKVSIPLGVTLTANPAAQKLYCVFSLSF